MKKSKWRKIGLTALILIPCLLLLFEGNFKYSREQKEKEESVNTVHVSEDEPGELYAQSAVLMDADSGRILFGKNEEKIRPMASTTKIMTCILALELMKNDQIAEVSELAVRQPKVHLGVKMGEKYYLKDLLYSLMLESHNDTAVVVAEAIGGSVKEFADMMNEKAEDIGCENTYFITPNGLDEKDEKGIHSTTAADLAKIMSYCIEQSPKKKEFLEVTGTKTYAFKDLEGKRSFSCNNHNAFLTMMDGAISGKTGFTAEAGYCYVGALRREERTFVVALLACGWPGNKSYKWKDTKKLMEFGLSHYRYKDVRENMPEEKLEVRGGANEIDKYELNSEIIVGVPKQEKDTPLRVLMRDGEQVNVRKSLKPYLNAPVKIGEKAGEYVYILDRKVIKRYEIVTLEAAEKRNLEWCIKVIFERASL